MLAASNLGIADVERNVLPLIRFAGDFRFANSLLKCWHDLCGAEFCTVYFVDEGQAHKVSSGGIHNDDLCHRKPAIYLDQKMWEKDPMIAIAKKDLEVQPMALVHQAIGDLPDRGYRDMLYGGTNVCDRVLVCSPTSAGLVFLVLLRTWASGLFSSADLERMNGILPTVMETIAKHIDLGRGRADPGSSLRSIDEIELTMATSTISLSNREAQVCARMLYGMSTCGIALDLSISEETIVTYRKRAYQRLEIGSQRELLLWYLHLWSDLHLRGSHALH